MLVGERPLSVAKVLKALRRNSRSIAGKIFARVVGRRKYACTLLTEEISSVLICRINGRLGNTVFLTPLIRRVHELIPNASIDLALSYPHATELFRNFPGVRRVIAFPHKGAMLVPNYLAALIKVRSQRYDLVIDPVAESTGGTGK